MSETKIQFIFLTLILLIWKTEAVDVTAKCSFDETDYFSHLVYQCTISNENEFIGYDVKIIGVEGIHLSGKSDNDVNAFYLLNAKQLTKIPLNIENFFKNLTFLILQANIFEIGENDIKTLSNLKSFWLQRSKVKVIRSDLFKSHPQLEIIVLDHNEISHIDHDTFDHLNDLKVLFLNNNPCGILNYALNRSDVLKIVEQIKNGECQSEEYFITTTTTTTENLKDIEDSDKNKQIEELKQHQETLIDKIEQCEANLVQQFDNFTNYNQKYITENQELSQQIAILNEKVENIENSNKNSSNFQILIEKFVQSDEKRDKCETKIDKCEAKIDKYEAKMEKCETKIDKCESRVDSFIEQASTLASVIKTLEDQLKLQKVLLEDKIDQYRKLEQELDRIEKAVKEINQKME